MPRPMRDQLPKTEAFFARIAETVDNLRQIALLRLETLGPEALD